MFSYTSYGIFGVWPDGHDIFNFISDTECFNGIIVGTHIANDEMFLFNQRLCTYNVSSYKSNWITYNYDYNEYNNLSYVDTLTSTYGFSYTSYLAKKVLPNIVAVRWI